MTGERILIVEDERAVARGLEYGLRKEGFEVLWAETGRQALDLARTRDPRLILLDIRLPDISGFDVCRELRAEGRRQPILMLTFFITIIVLNYTNSIREQLETLRMALCCRW